MSTDGPRRSLVDRVSRLEQSDGLRAAAMRAYLAVHHGFARVGVQVLRASYDSPVPRVRDLPESVFERDNPMRGIDWDPGAQMAWAEAELAPFLAEFQPAPDPDAPTGRFRLDTVTFDRVDAELLYAIVRWAKPARLLELGSGYSTLVAAEALVRNADEGRPCDLACLDPYPSPHVLARPDLAPKVRDVAAQELDEAEVASLEAGDVLFVDTSHTVKIGGDVNRIVLELLPLVRPGVIVHFHDVFLPRDYSRGHLDDGHYWNEQYLVQAFLIGNTGWEVLVSGMGLAVAEPERLGALIPSFHVGVSPGSIWLRRRDVS
jgi:predicted O-methyltransferase YrrM